jgi:hypothetical protein
LSVLTAGDDALVSSPATEVQRHLLAQLGGGVDALEVDVQHQLLPGVHLEVAQQHLLGLAGQSISRMDAVEGFLLQREVQRVVVELDHLGLAAP